MSAGVTVEVARAESARFRHPLLLLHGSWTGGWVWSRFAGYLAHRGWESWMPSLLDGSPPPDIATRVRALCDVGRAMPAAPIVVAHDSAIGVAAQVAVEMRSPVLVAIAPWLPTAFDRMRLAPWWRFSACVAPPSATHPLLAGIGNAASRLRPESSSVVWSSLDVAMTIPGNRGHVIAVLGDSATPVARAQRWARRRGWSCDVHESIGHFPMLANGGERLADRVHRWIVQATGHSLLLCDEDEERNADRET